MSLANLTNRILDLNITTLKKPMELLKFTLEELHKKGGKTDNNNCRPLSNLVSFGKLHKKLVFSKIEEEDQKWKDIDNKVFASTYCMPGTSSVSFKCLPGWQESVVLYIKHLGLVVTWWHFPPNLLFGHFIYIVLVYLWYTRALCKDIKDDEICHKTGP